MLLAATADGKGIAGRLVARIGMRFAANEYDILTVSNKFQTRFDQLLLVAMYVDEPLSGVAAVQN